MKITPGEIFAIKCNKGFGFLQFVGTDQFGIEIVRVLEPIKPKNEINQEEVDYKERFTIHFVVRAALRKKILQRTVIFPIPSKYKIPTKGREKHMIRGEFIGWHIVDLKSLKMELKNALTSDDLLLPPAGHPNDTLLIEWLDNNWRLEYWI